MPQGRDFEVIIDRSLGSDAARYRAVTMQMEDNTWKHVVVLFDSEYHEYAGEDSAIVDWCSHNHRTEPTAYYCRHAPSLRRHADELNRKMNDE